MLNELCQDGISKLLTHPYRKARENEALQTLPMLSSAYHKLLFRCLKVCSVLTHLNCLRKPSFYSSCSAPVKAATDAAKICSAPDN